MYLLKKRKFLYGHIYSLLTMVLISYTDFFSKKKFIKFKNYLYNFNIKLNFFINYIEIYFFNLSKKYIRFFFSLFPKIVEKINQLIFYNNYLLKLFQFLTGEAKHLFKSPIINKENIIAHIRKKFIKKKLNRKNLRNKFIVILKIYRKFNFYKELRYKKINKKYQFLNNIFQLLGPLEKKDFNKEYALNFQKYFIKKILRLDLQKIIEIETINIMPKQFLRSLIIN